MISPDQRDQRTTDAIAQFWTQALPLVQAHTSHPQLLVDALAQIHLPQPGAMDGGMGGYGGMGAEEIPKQLADAIRQAHESAKQRVPVPEP